VWKDQDRGWHSAEAKKFPISTGSPFGLKGRRDEECCGMLHGLQHRVNDREEGTTGGQAQLGRGGA